MSFQHFSQTQLTFNLTHAADFSHHCSDQRQPGLEPQTRVQTRPALEVLVLKLTALRLHKFEVHLLTAALAFHGRSSESKIKMENCMEKSNLINILIPKGRSQTTEKRKYVIVSNGLITLSDSDLDSDFKPNGYIALCRSF